MRRLSLVSAVAGLLLAVCVPARAESARREPDAKAKAKAAAQEGCAARKAAKASEARPAPLTPSSDTIVVPASADQPGFTMVGENVTYADPSFVPYKLREAARRARASVDISKIP